MPVILNIETSTDVCSTALTCDGEVLFNRENYKSMSHASSLGGYVQEALSEAKGLCFGLDIPLIAVDTLAVMACAVMFRKNIDETALLCPMIDARRMEV